jgi:hypothetical protein
MMNRSHFNHTLSIQRWASLGFGIPRLRCFSLRFERLFGSDFVGSGNGAMAFSVAQPLPDESAMLQFY